MPRMSNEHETEVQRMLDKTGGLLDKPKLQADGKPATDGDGNPIMGKVIPEDIQQLFMNIEKFLVGCAQSSLTNSEVATVLGIWTTLREMKRPKKENTDG
jgi:hypothetical protein